MFENFVKWVGQPEAYNWITLIAAVAALATAVFTGYTALTTWADRRKSVGAEWKLELSGDHFVIHAHIHNGLATTIEGDRATVKGPVTGVKSGRGEKHWTWASNATSLFPLEVEPGKTGQIAVRVQPDAKGMRSIASSWYVKPRFWITVIAWNALHWRYSSGVRFSITALVRRRSSVMRPIRLTHTIRIQPAQAIKMAEAIESSDDKK